MRNDLFTQSDDVQRSVPSGRLAALLPIGSLTLHLAAALFTGIAIGAQNNWYALVAALVFALGLVCEMFGRTARQRRQLLRRERSKKYLNTDAIPVVPPAKPQPTEFAVPVTTGSVVAAPSRTLPPVAPVAVLPTRAVPYALVIPAVCPGWVRASRVWANRVVDRLPALTWQATLPSVTRQKFFFTPANSIPALSGGQILHRAWYQQPEVPDSPQQALGERVRAESSGSDADPVTLQHLCVEINKLLHTIDSIPVVPPAATIDVTDDTLRSQNNPKSAQHG